MQIFLREQSAKSIQLCQGDEGCDDVEEHHVVMVQDPHLFEYFDRSSIRLTCLDVQHEALDSANSVDLAAVGLVGSDPQIVELNCLIIVARELELEVTFGLIALLNVETAAKVFRLKLQALLAIQNQVLHQRSSNANRCKRLREVRRRVRRDYYFDLTLNLCQVCEVSFQEIRIW